MYVLINIAILLPVLALSFDKKVHFYTEFKSLFASIFIVAIPFLIWDEWFTEREIWGFTPKYLSGIYWGHLPLGELLFFITVPYACLFINSCLKAYFTFEIPKTITVILFSCYLSFYLFLYTDNFGLYSTINLSYFLLLTALLFLFKKTGRLFEFFPAYIITLIPFLLVNGILTGAGLDEPIVWYNNAENTGLRIGTIPYDDFLYSFNLLFSVYWIKVTLATKLK